VARPPGPEALSASERPWAQGTRELARAFRLHASEHALDLAALLGELPAFNPHLMRLAAAEAPGSRGRPEPRGDSGFDLALAECFYSGILEQVGDLEADGDFDTRAALGAHSPETTRLLCRRFYKVCDDAYAEVSLFRSPADLGPDWLEHLVDMLLHHLNQIARTDPLVLRDILDGSGRDTQGMGSVLDVVRAGVAEMWGVR